jgi:hypothetical protein
MISPLLLCTDLDRTVLPNGSQPESRNARPFFKKLAAKTGVILAYVSGRDQKLLLDAIAEFDLPLPDYAVCDVGTTIYEISGNRWQAWNSWQEEIQADWQGKNWQDLRALLADLDFLELQEPEKQKTFKLSYYTRAAFELEKTLARIRGRLEQAGIRASLIWSVDEPVQRGLLDILPESANKLQAITFLMRRKGFDAGHTVFAGDSGNDMAVLTSGLKAILVGNASREVRDEAQRYLAATDQLEQLYIARGDFLGMNGNYAAGVVEGVGHFFPEILADIS